MTELAKRYGGSLYDLAAEEKLTEELLQELQTAVDSIEAEPQYKRLLATPGVPKKERCALLDKAFEGAHPYLVNFLKLLCEENLIGELPGVLRAYRDRYNEDNGILEVTAVSAVALAAPAREKLLAKLQKMTGKNVVLTETVDPSVLGGLRLDMGGKRLDGTVQRHYYKHLKGEETSTNSVATIFAWTGALRKRGELDGNAALMDFADKLEKATIQTIEDGKMTKDLALITTLLDVKVLNSADFIKAIRATYDAMN